MKRLLLLLFMACMSVLAKAIVIDSLTYSISRTYMTASLIGCLNRDTVSISIPGQIEYEDEKYTVTQVGGLSSFNNLVSVGIPSTVKTISGGAFKDCSALESVSFPNSLETIGNGAFTNCVSLKGVEFGDSLKVIMSSFGNCTSLQTVTIPASVTSVYSNAFSGCENLKSVKLVDGDQYLSISEDVFYNCPIEDLYLGRDTGVTNFQYSTLIRVEYGNNVTSVPQFTFSGCENLRTLVLSNSIEEIGYHALRNCAKLIVISGGANVNLIGTGAFANCTSLTSAFLPSNIKTIYGDAFRGCTSITGVVFPGSIETISSYSFADCSNLESVRFSANRNGETLKCPTDAFKNSPIKSAYVDRDFDGNSSTPFYGMESLTSVEFGPNMTQIQAKAFYNCTNLITPLTFPSNIKKIGTLAFVYCPGITKLELYNGTEEVGDRAFYGCSNLKTLWIHDGYDEIKLGSAFDNTNIEEFYMGRNVSASSTFLGNGIGQSLQKLTISPFVTNINTYNMFYWCENLKTIKVECSNPPETVKDNVFCQNTYDNATLQVPEGKIDAYKNSEYCWRLFKYLNEESGVNDIMISTSDDAKVELFTLQGVKVVGDPTPGLYIKRVGGKTSKVVVN